MKKIFILCVMILWYHFLNAQNSIKGKITDQDNLPLAGTNVFLPEINKGTISDKNGYYELVNLPNGKLKIQFSFIGYINKIETVVLDGTSLDLNINLQTSILKTEEIVVTGGYSSTQHENAVKIEALKFDLLEVKATPNFAEVLTKIPGVDMISKGSGVSKPVIRGLSMNDILVLNNGVRFENYQYSDHHPLGIDEFGIEDIEIIKGPASLLYGSDAIGGVINFIKEKPAPVGEIKGDYNLQLFSNSLGATNNLGIKGTSKNFYGGIRFGNKTNADYLQGGGDFVPNTRFYSNSLKVNTGFNNKNMSLNIFYDYSKNKIGLAEQDAIDYVKGQGRGRKPEVYYMLLDNNLLSIRNKFFLNKFKLEINSAYQKSGLIHSEGPNDIAIEMSLQTITYETRLYLPSDENSEYIIGFQGMNQTNTNLNNRGTKLLPDAATNNYSAFGLLQRTFFKKLNLQTGIRYDSKTIKSEAIGIPYTPGYRASLDKNFGSFSGSFGSTYNVSEELLFRANVAAAYRTPNLAELTSNGLHETRYEVGDQNLIPENSYEFDFSMHYHKENFTFDIAGFYNIINHYIYITPTDDTTITGINIYKYMQNNSSLFGCEAGIHYHPESMKWLHFQSTFSTVIGKQKNGDYLPFIPANKLNFEIKAVKEKLSFVNKAFITVNSNTAFNQNNAAPDESTTTGYTLFDLSIGGNIKMKNQLISIGISANNILDKKYVDHLSTLKEVSYFNPGRNIAFTLKVPFVIKKNE